MSKYVEAANWISKQRQSKKPFQNFNELFDLRSFEDAYLVQDELETIWAHKGQVTGYKLALTSKVMQKMFGNQYLWTSLMLEAAHAKTSLQEKSALGK